MVRRYKILVDKGVTREYNGRMPFRKREYIIIFIIALALRIGMLAALHSTPSFFDPDYVTDSWDKISTNVLEGHGFSWVTDGSYPTIARGPGYTLFLAALMVVSKHDLLTVRVLYLLLDSILVLLILRLSYRILESRSSAIWASLAYTVFLLPAWHTAKLSPDVFYSFLLLAALVLFLESILTRESRNPSLSIAIISGALFGLAILTKKTILFLPAFWIVLALSKMGLKKSTITAIAVWLLAIGMSITPWLYRNYKLTGRFAFVQTVTWYVYWNGVLGDHELRGLNRDEFPEWAADYIRELRMDGHRMPIPLPPDQEIARSQKLKQLAYRHIKEDFGYCFGRSLRNLARFWYLTSTGRAISYTKFIGIIVFAFFAFGTAVTIIKRKINHEALLLLSAIVYFNFVYAPIHAVLRYMIPVAPYVAVFAGVGLSSLWQAAISLFRPLLGREKAHV